MELEVPSFDQEVKSQGHPASRIVATPTAIINELTVCKVEKSSNLIPLTEY